MMGFQREAVEKMIVAAEIASEPGDLHWPMDVWLGIVPQRPYYYGMKKPMTMRF
jgi:hypothetical protein